MKREIRNGRLVIFDRVCSGARDPVRWRMMIWLARVFASAIVRRLAYMLVAVVLVWAGMGKAHAQTPPDYSKCLDKTAFGSYFACPNRSDAYAGSEAAARHQLVGYATIEIVTITAQGCYQGSCMVLVNMRGKNTGDWRASAAGRSWPENNECPADTSWDATLGQCVNTLCRDAGIWNSKPADPSLRGVLRCLVTIPPGSDPTLPGGIPGAGYCMYAAQTLVQGQPNAGYVGFVTTGKTCNPEDFQCPVGYERGTGMGSFNARSCQPIKTCEVGDVDPVTGECPSPDKCPEGQEKGPLGDCRSKNNDCGAGQIRGPDDSCVDDPQQCKDSTFQGVTIKTVKGKDGSCKPDEDEDGEPDEETGHKATDSASCDQPPVCAGDEIMCLHAKQLWRVDCNTRRTGNVTLDMYCKSPPVCERIALGDNNRSMGCSKQEEAALILQWNNVCEVRKTNEKLDALLAKGTAVGEGGDKCGPGTNDANCNKQPDWTENAGDGVGTDPGAGSMPGDAIKVGEAIGTGGLNTAGYGYGSSCPTIPDVTINGQTIHFDTSVFCNWLKLGGQFVLICAALLSLTIMTRSSS